MENSKNISDDAISTKMDHGKTTECQSCKRSFSSLAQHLRQSPNCQTTNGSTITDDATSTEQDFEFAEPHVEIKHPWDVSNLEEFHFYCCPECDLKEKTKDRFVRHALENHTESKEHLGKLLIKQEIHEDEKKVFGGEESSGYVTIKEEYQEQEEDEEYYNYNDNEFGNENTNYR